jgi:hypothetical protein
VLYILVILLTFFVAAALLRDLGAGCVPHPIRPVANVWVRAGYDPKWVTVAVWVVFATMVFVSILLIGISLYQAVVHLGTQRY